MPPKESFLNRPFVSAATVLGIGLMLGAGIVSYTLYAMRGFDNTLSVTGSATQQVTADLAKWRVSVSRTAYQADVSTAYGQVTRDAATVKAYFTAAGIDAASTTLSTVAADQIYGSDSNAPVRYTVHEEILVESTDVHKIEALAQKITELSSKGVFVTAQQPEYYVTALPALRVSLLGKAIADAKARAEQIAGRGGSSVGKLQSAASGVVQVMTPNSTNVDDYGMYDTSTIEKQVMVTARATFFVK